ncbi:NADPH cytochrome P450 oxidoreductase family protein [Pseudooceanicola sp. HF7]|uniref:flavodoxin domain-containing protein n=1 Tax=Pseudooceanicola sp. HF7 TaxID=2721560 RepID=UPI001431972D|nr:NADPH cytochrome P450 oxidoreductase family protein [Pseudooceanicola sp. HF7]NIZ11345.1 hypothetical protein [Pseudooceanicola sp. HF7]
MIALATNDPLRIATAVALALAWLALLAWRRGGRQQDAPTGGPLVLYASQTGMAEELARAQARRMGTRAMALGEVSARQLARAGEAFFLLSSTGDGEAPDNARGFTLPEGADLSGLRYGLMSLGDRRYPSFCGFGRQVDGWLRQGGARPLFDPLEVDRAAPSALAAELARWEGLTGQGGAPDLWHLTERAQITPAEEAEPVYRLALTPSAPVDWAPGAIAEIQLSAPDGQVQRRSYSVASLPESGAVELVLRRRCGAEGVPGLGSAWLTGGLGLGGAVRMRLRDNPNLAALEAAQAEDRPLLMIATGTGLAAVLGPLRARLAQGKAPLWLIHGARYADFPQIAALRDDPRLRVDALLSRGPDPRRVPEFLTTEAEALRAFLSDEALVLICGSRAPGTAVLVALSATLPETTFTALRRDGRLLTDLY